MATADQLKQGGNAAKLGAMPPQPVARGFTPASGNSSTPKPGAARPHPVGKITGKGTGTSDQVPINASNGEFIIKAAAVKKIGLEVLEALNAVADGPDEKDGKAEALAEYGGAGAPRGMRLGGQVRAQEAEDESFHLKMEKESEADQTKTQQRALNTAYRHSGIEGGSDIGMLKEMMTGIPHMANAGSVDEAQKRAALLSQIPAGPGANPAPAPDGKDSTEFGRQANNSLAALGGMGAAASVPLKTAQAVQGTAMRAARAARSATRQPMTH